MTSPQEKTKAYKLVSGVDRFKCLRDDKILYLHLLNLLYLASFLDRLPPCGKCTPSNTSQTRRWPFDCSVGRLMPLTASWIVICLFGLGFLPLESHVLSRLILDNKRGDMWFPKGGDVGKKIKNWTCNIHLRHLVTITLI